MESISYLHLTVDKISMKGSKDYNKFLLVTGRWVCSTDFNNFINQQNSDANYNFNIIWNYIGK